MRAELKAMIRLAVPVVIAELGWISMGIVDTIFVGPLGPAALGAVGTGSTMFFALAVFGMGTLLALDTFVSQSFGARRIDDCHRWLFAGLQLGFVLSVVLIVAAIFGVRLLPALGMHPAVLALLQPYLSAVVWSIPPLMAYTVFRRYLQAMHVVRPVMIALISANVVNAVGNWIFVYGKFGSPAFGVVGSAYATLGARLYLAGVLLAVILYRERKNPSGFHDVPWAWDATRVRQLLRLGLPAAVQVMLEVGVFAAAGALAARITPVALAANQIVLNIAGFFYMVPFGISSAAAVRVGHAVGRRDPSGVRRAGWAAFGVALAFAVAASLVFVVSPGPFLRVFTADAGVLRVGVVVLFVYALVQPLDGAQVVATGALRGLGETRVPMLLNLAAHWGVGLPIAYLLCFTRGWGVAGLWAGLGISLAIIGTALVAVWRVRSRAPLLHGAEPAGAVDL